MLLNLIKKDLKLIFLDKEYLIVVLLMPIIISSILSFALQSAFDSTIEINQFDIGVVYNPSTEQVDFPFIDESDFDEETLEDVSGDYIFFDQFLNQDEINDIMNYKRVSYDEGIRLMKDNQISALIILEEDFSQDLLYNFVSPFRKPIKIRLIKNGARNISPEITEEILKGFASQINQRLVAKNILIELSASNDVTIDYDNMGSFFEMDEQEMLDINFENTAVDQKETVSSADYYSGAMLAMFLLFVAGSSSTLLLDEKDNMTYHRMITSGVSFTKILTSKFIMIFLLALFEGITMVTYSALVLKVNWGDMTTIGLLVIFSAVTVASFGLMLSLISFYKENRKLTILLNSVVFQVLAAIGGSFIPVEALPNLLQKLRYLPFNGVILKVILNAMQGLTYQESFMEFGLLGVNVLIFLSISLYLIKKGEDHHDHGNEDPVY